MRIGIFFGGQSREREVSFAGGRTVFDNLDKNLFEAVPVFVDSLGNFILLDWQYIYKGTIRDFYPPSRFDSKRKNPFQVYLESLELSKDQLNELFSSVGKKIEPADFHIYFDFAFLALHGPQGEDGAIQGLLEWYQIPYSGSGLLPSSIGINKIVQKKLFQDSQSLHPKYEILEKNDWDNKDRNELFESIRKNVGSDLVVKAPHQGSSIGISIIKNADFESFESAVEKAFFRDIIDLKKWFEKTLEDKIRYINAIADIRTGIGFPLLADNELIYHPEDLMLLCDESKKENILTKSNLSEDNILIESFIPGEEFSCIVVENEFGDVIALPPTQIIKPSDLFDYRSKYLPGISRKITPINLPAAEIQSIREACEKLFSTLNCDVYARIDGFISNGEIYLNDPNTTSGMLPSSFFFHQAAEIGLNPSQFLTFIIRSSIKSRIKSGKYPLHLADILQALDEKIKNANTSKTVKERVAVIMGGFSSERHISVESGRNIYEKLSSSTEYLPFPVFLTGDENGHQLYQIPINVMLKDNADDIRDKLFNYKVHPVVEEIRKEALSITQKYSTTKIQAPFPISYDELVDQADLVFIALHGRPGEDGTVQKELEKRNIPFNGSLPDSSEITINKFETNEILRQNGILVADHFLVSKEAFEKDQNVFYTTIETKFNYPFIAKPADDGCSSAVTKVKNREMLEAYSRLIFRTNEELDNSDCDVLKIGYNEEFPRKNVFVIETLIGKEGAAHFLEITGGLVTHFDKYGIIQIEMFEPSEALATGDVLSLEEKFLAGEGQNITPARYSGNNSDNFKISEKVKEELKKVAEILNIQGYARIDAFVRIYSPDKIEVIIIEINSLPGMTPATCIFHQSAINKYTPLAFISEILKFGKARSKTIKSF